MRIDKYTGTDPSGPEQSRDRRDKYSIKMK